MSTSKEQYVIVTRDWVLLCPESVDSRLKAESHLPNVACKRKDRLVCSVETYYEIRSHLIACLKCTQSFDKSDVWVGIGGMKNWVELAGFANKLIGNDYFWAKEELESRGLEPHWVVNLQEALGIFSRAPLPVIKGGGDTALKIQTPPIGSFIQGGFYAGLVNVKGVDKAIIVAPKMLGEYAGKWSRSNSLVAGAMCQTDGQQNTRDMIAAGVELGLWVQALNVNGLSDWHIPSKEEQDIVCRAFGSETQFERFMEGGVEAFDKACYWTSTQFSDSSAWVQGFYFGCQYYDLKTGNSRARAVRTINVSDLAMEIAA